MPNWTEPQVTATPEQTEALGAALADELQGGETIALHGDLGTGKTVFARGLARGLGIAEPVTSPTFPIVQEYLGARLRFYHLDLYRLHGEEDAIAFGIEDYLDSPGAITIIEWAERISGLLAPETIEIHLEHLDARRRRLSLRRRAVSR